MKLLDMQFGLILELTYKVTTILFTVLVIITEQKQTVSYSVINFVKPETIVQMTFPTF